MIPGDSTLELGVCLGHYHPTTTPLRRPLGSETKSNEHQCG
jgi:hypothetical protein